MNDLKEIQDLVDSLNNSDTDIPHLLRVAYYRGADHYRRDPNKFFDKQAARLRKTIEDFSSDQLPQFQNESKPTLESNESSPRSDFDSSFGMGF